MDDLNKIFSGISMYEKLYSQNNTMSSITALSNPLSISNWIQKSNENLAINAIAGNSIRIWESLLNTPKVSDYNSMSSIMSISNFINNLHNTTSVSNSLNSLAGKMDWFSDYANQPHLYSNNWTKSLLAGSSMIEVLSKSQILNNTSKLSNTWAGLLHPELVKQKKKKIEKNITNAIDSFADNVATVFSQIEDFDEGQRNLFATNVNEALTYEANSNIDAPSYFVVLEWMLNKYNEAIESAIIVNNVEELKNIYNQLKKITIVGWVSIITIMALSSIVGNKADSLLDSLTGNKEIVKSNFELSYNAKTNSSKPLLIEPDDKTEVLCIIPDCTEVQLGNIEGKYIFVRLLHNGTVQEGWCLNKGFTK
jgi:hypothetical protein